MNVHKNTRLTPIGRERIVMQVTSGQTPQAVARAAGVCPRTVRKWVARYAAEGITGLQDRSSRPRRLNRPTPQHIAARIGELRRQRLSGKHFGIENQLYRAGSRPKSERAWHVNLPMRWP